MAVILVTKRIRLLSLWIINFRLYAAHTHTHTVSSISDDRILLFPKSTALTMQTHASISASAHQFVHKISRSVVSFHFIYTAHFIFGFFSSSHRRRSTVVGSFRILFETG